MAIKLPDLDTEPDRALLCRLLLVETRTPERVKLYKADLAKTHMQAIRAIVDNRLKTKPTSQFNAPNATTWTEIIASTKKPFQFEGIRRRKKKDGTLELVISPKLTARLDGILAIANNSTHPRQEITTAHVQIALDISAADTNEDPFKDLTEINKIKVLPGAFAVYAFGQGDPGGDRYVTIPSSLNGVIMGNQFYALKQK